MTKGKIGAVERSEEFVCREPRAGFAAPQEGLPLTPEIDVDQAFLSFYRKTACAPRQIVFVPELPARMGSHRCSGLRTGYATQDQDFLAVCSARGGNSSFNFGGAEALNSFALQTNPPTVWKDYLHINAVLSVAKSASAANLRARILF